MQITDVPKFDPNDPAWDSITGTNFRDVHGTLLWSEPPGRFHRPGELLVHDGVQVRVRGVVVLSNAQEVCCEPPW